MMPALSFQGMWLDTLLSGDKQQTTRQRTDRIKVGDTISIYNQQRKAIASKPLRELTPEGRKEMRRRIRTSKTNSYPPMLVSRSLPTPNRWMYPAHILGRVVAREVYDLHPCEMSEQELYDWARADGFDTFADADAWFTAQYDADWMQKEWTVIRWNGWLDRYFEPQVE